MKNKLMVLTLALGVMSQALDAQNFLSLQDGTQVRLSQDPKSLGSVFFDGRNYFEINQNGTSWRRLSAHEGRTAYRAKRARQAALSAVQNPRNPISSKTPAVAARLFVDRMGRAVQGADLSHQAEFMAAISDKHQAAKVATSGFLPEHLRKPGTLVDLNSKIIVPSQALDLSKTGLIIPKTGIVIPTSAQMKQFGTTQTPHVTYVDMGARAAKQTVSRSTQASKFVYNPNASNVSTHFGMRNPFQHNQNLSTARNYVDMGAHLPKVNVPTVSPVTSFASKAFAHMTPKTAAVFVGATSAIKVVGGVYVYNKYFNQPKPLTKYEKVSQFVTTHKVATGSGIAVVAAGLGYLAYKKGFFKNPFGKQNRRK